MDKDKVASTLNGLALQRRYLDSLNIPHFGPSNGPCIVVDGEPLEVSVFFAEHQLPVVTANFESVNLKQLMDELQRLCAHLSVASDGTVSCRIGEVVAMGDSYAIAGMRACISAGQPG